MPRVHFVKSARKADPAHGIEVGDSYYWWKFRYGGKRKSKTKPRKSQLTQSDKLGRLYDLEDQLNAVEVGDNPAIEDIVSELQSIADDVRAVGEEYQESADNIRQSFENSPTADECEEKAGYCEETAESIEEAISQLEALDVDEEPLEDLVQQAQEIINNINWSV